MVLYRAISGVTVKAEAHTPVERATGCTVPPEHHSAIALRLQRLREGTAYWLHGEIDEIERLLRLK